MQMAITLVFIIFPHVIGRANRNEHLDTTSSSYNL
jgi:hypothetical protein